MDIPFGILVIDGNEVGIELINHNNVQNFYAGIFIKDKKLATNIKEFISKCGITPLIMILLETVL